MEVEKWGPSDSSRESGDGVKVAPDRYTAYIPGAGSRLARLSWDTDGRGICVPLMNGEFESLLEGWTASSGLTAGIVQDPQRGNAVQLTRQSTGESYIEGSLGTFQAGDRIEATALVRSVAGVTGGQLKLVFYPGGVATAQAGATSSYTSWQPVGVSWTLPKGGAQGTDASGELRLRLEAVGTELSSVVFDSISVRHFQDQVPASGKSSSRGCNQRTSQLKKRESNGWYMRKPVFIPPVF